MDKEELEKYEYQLSGIKVALQRDPSNVEYLNLKEELESLIDLTKEYLASTAPAPAPSVASHTAASVASSSRVKRDSTPSTLTSTAPAAAAVQHDLKAGDDCQARYSGDNKFYPARIVSVGGSSSSQVFSVLFAGYSTTEIVAGVDIKPLSESKKRAAEVSEKDKAEKGEKERKKKKMEKKVESREAKTQEQQGKQSAWQSFAKKSTKKGTSIPGMAGESMFKSPEDGNPNARVGVVNSGRAMTAAVTKVRQTFRET